MDRDVIDADGLRAEILYAIGDRAEVYKILESSRSAREYILLLTGPRWYEHEYAYDDEDVRSLEEFQAIARVMHAKSECMGVLAELGLSR